MERIPNGKYTKEFRVEAVEIATEGGLSVPESGHRLSGARILGDQAQRLVRRSLLLKHL